MMATLLLQGYSANQNAGTIKMLPPSGEESHSPNKNAGFPDTTKNHVLPKHNTMLTSITCYIYTWH